MFDLHMHTCYSDGVYKPDELVSRLKKENINLFSITDHNHSLAYEDYSFNDIKYIKGTEIATSSEDVIIEVLGYKVDDKIINNWYRDFFSEDNLKRNEQMLFDDLLKISKKNGYKIQDSLNLEEIKKGVSKKTIFYYLQENYSDFPFKTYKDFFRKGLSNNTSEWFLNEGRTYPSLGEVIQLIHEADGLAVLAHPYEYGFEKLDNLFNTVKNFNINGIECFHPSASMYNSVELSKFCVENNLIGSGGSDFHSDKRLVPLGVHINEELFKLKCFDWIKELL